MVVDVKIFLVVVLEKINVIKKKLLKTVKRLETEHAQHSALLESMMATKIATFCGTKASW